MIPDKKFKSLQHNLKEYSKYLCGQSLEPGYKPDYVLKNGNNYVILELENSSSRKTYVGGMIKAAHFLQKEKKGILVFVIVPKKNTKASSIASHLKLYYNWIREKANLESVYVIEACDYYKEDVLLELICADFKKLAHKVSRLLILLQQVGTGWRNIILKIIR